MIIDFRQKKWKRLKEGVHYVRLLDKNKKPITKPNGHPIGQTLTDIYYILDNGAEILIPKGFCFDFASIPKWAWWIVGNPVEHATASLLHDFLYCSRILGKKEADRLFLLALKRVGERLLVRRVMYRAVHFFGGRPFNVTDERATVLSHYIYAKEDFISLINTGLFARYFHTLDLSWYGKNEKVIKQMCKDEPRVEFYKRWVTSLIESE